MDWLTFIAEIVKALAWPASVFVSVWLLRKPLAQLLPFTRSVKYKEFSIEFGREMEELRERATRELPNVMVRALPATSLKDRLLALATVSPNAAIFEAWREVERAALALMETQDMKVSPSLKERSIGHLLQGADLVDAEKMAIFDELRRLRNRVAHAHGAEATPEQALEFTEVALALIVYLEQRAKK